jgi:hypothetical protein
MQRLSDPTTAGDPTSLRADFSQAMADLEDLLEVYGGIGL